MSSPLTSSLSSPLTTPLSFQDIIEVIEIPGQDNGSRRFISKRPAWAPLGGLTYGGHVFAQAAWAAAQTVDEEMVIHNITGFFTFPGLTDRPFIFTVVPITNGRTYSVRSIIVHQPTNPSATSSSTFAAEDASSPPGRICFTAHASFKKDEDSCTRHQPPADLHARYPFLATLNIDEIPDAPDVDSPWFIDWLSRNNKPLSSFKGLRMKKPHVPTNTTDPYTYRQLTFYAPILHAPISGPPNLHACAHLLASDRNSLSLISNAHGFGDRIAKIASLSHTVVFHVPSHELRFDLEEAKGKGGDAKWWVQEAWSPRSEGGRGIHESWIWSPNGRHIASSWQEGLVRKADGLALIARLARSGKL